MFPESLVKTIKLFPSFLEIEEKEKLGEKVTLKEIEDALKIFKKEKSSGLDGWIVDLFLHFFDIMEEDQLAIVEFF